MICVSSKKVGLYCWLLTPAKYHLTSYQPLDLLQSGALIYRVLTEELEEGGETTIYDDYKFLTREDLDKLHITHLIGTNLLRAYMHGFFIDYLVYKKALALANPFSYESYIEKRRQEKLEAERASRITIKRKLPKVNRTLAAQLLQEEEAKNEKKYADVGDPEKTSDAKKKWKKKKGISSKVLKDERFSAMFEDKEFEVDEDSREYLALSPYAIKQISRLYSTIILKQYQEMKNKVLVVMMHHQQNRGSKLKKKSQAQRFYEVKDNRHAEAFWSRKSFAEEESLPLGERLASQRLQETSNYRTIGYGRQAALAVEVAFVGGAGEEDGDEV